MLQDLYSTESNVENLAAPCFPLKKVSICNKKSCAIDRTFPLHRNLITSS